MERRSAVRRRRTLPGLCILAAGLAAAAPASAQRAELPRAFASTVSVLPDWPRHRAASRARRDEPEGTAVAIRAGGYLATALHVVDRATAIRVRTPDGRLFVARLAARDAMTDLALLKVELDLPPIEIGGPAAVGDPVCAIGNQFGLGLSATCGVVSAVGRSGVGFNPIEDFVQTDASVNPGASGGPLIDRAGRLVGLLSAIFTKASDADIGVNFAASAALLRRVFDDLIASGQVLRGAMGLTVADVPRRHPAAIEGALVRAVSSGAGAALQPGDVVTHVGGRRVRNAVAARSAWHAFRPGAAFTLVYRRGGEARRATARLSAIP